MERHGGAMGKTHYTIHLADALVWMDSREAQSVHAIVTDPPYGLKEYTDIEQRKLRNGRGGVWRIPPSFDGSTAGAQGGGRTHTFGLRLPAQKLRNAAAYQLPNIKLQGGKPVLVE